MIFLRAMEQEKIKVFVESCYVFLIGVLSLFYIFSCKPLSSDLISPLQLDLVTIIFLYL